MCALHSNELPLRHLLEALDGVTAGPRAFSGTIGKSLVNCEQLPVAMFQKIEADLPQITSKDLSTDQQYLYEICDSVIKGYCSLDLSRRDPGAISHSRWVTTANRILRLYIGSDKPSENLIMLATYVVKVYAPMWFHIKSKPSCKDGAVHLWRAIKLSRYLPDTLKAVVDPVLQRNGFFGHPENILLAMISDSRKNIRELGLRRILKARKSSSPGVPLRRFTIPKLNFSAADYVDLVDWQTVKVTEPPVIAELSQSNLESFVAEDDIPVVGFPRFPCHTQSVERFVKLVTESCAAVCGTKSRDGFILCRLKSRELMPSFNTKAEFRPQ